MSERVDITQKILLTRTHAAELLDIKPKTFDVYVKKGIVPPPVPGTKRWLRKAVERTLYKIAGIKEDGETPRERWKASQNEGQPETY